MTPTDASLGAYSFLPWVRRGIATSLTTEDAASAAARPTLDVVVDVRGGGSADPVHVRMLGPGDVVGLDPRQVIRCEPPPNTQTFEPNYFPFVELDLPELPWLFTPTKATAAHRLRPWLVLVVVRRQPGVTLEPPGRRPLPVLGVAAPALTSVELPDLAESWAWVHAQVAGTIPAGDPTSVLEGPPERTLARLMCPRRLDPGTDYIACLVPTFEVGRLAGLGTPDPSVTATLAPAWTGTDAERDLPVYFSWEFRTGVAGDFESLVRELRPRPVPQAVGVRPLYIGAAGSGLPTLPRTVPGATVGFEGALRAPGRTGPAWPTNQTLAWQAALEQILERPETLQAGDPQHPLTVAPPIYGRWLAAVSDVPATQPSWVRGLNLDPRQRAAAAVGTSVVQAQQEKLMEAAWEQAPRIRAANEALRQAQLARATTGSIYGRHVEPLADGLVLAIAAPVLPRLRMGSTTIALQARASALPVGALDPAFRRVMRPRGPLARRALAPTARRVIPWAELLDSGSVVAVRPSLTPAGLVRLRVVHEDRLRPGRIEAAPARPGFELLGEDDAPPGEPVEPGREDSPDAQVLRTAAIAVQQRIGTWASLDGRGPDPLGVAAVAADLRAHLDPEVTIASRVNGRVTRPSRWSPADPLEPIMLAPEFPAPMYRPLRDLSQDLLLPGAEHLGPNTFTALESNDDFIESYMVGVNHEMGRELLWREYPTDQRSTMFRQFWDVAGADPATPREDLYDIDPIDVWDPAAPLGGNMRRGGEQGRLVLLIRGELLGRYPNAVVSAVKAARTGTGQRELSTEERFPIFHARLLPDILLLGFDLDRLEALGGTATSPNGWFFVVQQQPTEPRFGLDVGDDADYDTTPTDWRSVSWKHLAASESALAQLHHAPVSTGTPAGWTIDGVDWQSDAAHLAWITLQRPVRIAIHADDVIA